MSTEPIRVGALGMGWWSDVLADAIKRTRSMDIAACYTRSDSKREAFAEKYGCRATSTYEELLADESIQGIINTTPNAVHLETVQQAAEAGKHVMCEKPMARDRHEARCMIEACRDAGVTLGVAYRRRLFPQVLEAKKQLAAGTIGPTVCTRSHYSGGGGFGSGAWGWGTAYGKKVP